MADWQPIATAPKKHGHEILVCAPGRMAVVEWLAREAVMHGDEEDFISGWYLSDGHNEPIWYRNWPYITHWMPLPDPPA